MFRTHLYQMGRPCLSISGTRNYTFISIHFFNNPHSPISSRTRHILSLYHWHLRTVKCLFVISSYFPQGKKMKYPQCGSDSKFKQFFFYVIEPQILVISSMCASGFIVICRRSSFNKNLSLSVTSDLQY